ncbi:MAG: NAD(P)H-dependent oxidoreductase subunit E [Puniceicoccales bacterium]|jgi:NADH-quinone oxidoreductase subunit E|nr:NAD(P)H-dependent oxidoreductase subunit E [Puniceicoccales bacterium]
MDNPGPPPGNLPFAPSPGMLEAAAAIVARYPEPRSATLPLLHRVQEENGWISLGAMRWVAEKTGRTPIEVLGVVSFYPMFRQAPSGRRHVRVCRTLSCALRGAEDTMRALEKELGCKRCETTADGAVTLEFVECLACCATGPVVQVDHALHEGVTPARVPALAAAVRASLSEKDHGLRPPVPGSPEWNG